MTKHLSDKLQEFFTIANSDMNTGKSQYDVDFNGLKYWIDEYFLSKEEVREAIGENEDNEIIQETSIGKIVKVNPSNKVRQELRTKLNALRKEID